MPRRTELGFPVQTDLAAELEQKMQAAEVQAAEERRQKVLAEKEFAHRFDGAVVDVLRDFAQSYAVSAKAVLQRFDDDGSFGWALVGNLPNQLHNIRIIVRLKASYYIFSDVGGGGEHVEQDVLVVTTVYAEDEQVRVNGEIDEENIAKILARHVDCPVSFFRDDIYGAKTFGLPKRVLMYSWWPYSWPFGWKLIK
jgi:hypothetical protein